jgi:acetoin utilization protein AcuC
MLNSLIEIKPDTVMPRAATRGTQAELSEACFVGSDVFRNEAFGAHHPLSIPRQSGVLEMCSILGWLAEGGMETCTPASEEQLSRFHDAAYISALKNAEQAGKADPDIRDRYKIGTMENPLFNGLFERAATAVGGSILAAQEALKGRVAFHPAGGTHHGRPDRASGFCYFNDPVFAILTLLDAGLERVLYIDLDAHHGDGVQDAMAGDERVSTISIHEKNRWPHSGPLDDRGCGRARNLPVPRGFNDSELDFLVHRAVLPLLQRFEPQAMVITCGADGLAGDPLSKLELSNTGLWQAVEDLVEKVPRTVVLGGGGYNPWTVVRCWSGLWGRLSGRDIPHELPRDARVLLQGFSCDLLDEEDVEETWISTLADQPNTGRVRKEVRDVAEQVLS